MCVCVCVCVSVSVCVCVCECECECVCMYECECVCVCYGREACTWSVCITFIMIIFITILVDKGDTGNDGGRGKHTHSTV